MERSLWSCIFHSVIVIDIQQILWCITEHVLLSWHYRDFWFCRQWNTVPFRSIRRSHVTTPICDPSNVFLSTFWIFWASRVPKKCWIDWNSTVQAIDALRMLALVQGVIPTCSGTQVLWRSWPARSSSSADATCGATQVGVAGFKISPVFGSRVKTRRDSSTSTFNLLRPPLPPAPLHPHITVVRQPQATPSLTLHCVAFTRMAFVPLPVPPSIPNDLLFPSPGDFVLFQVRLVITTLAFPKPLVCPLYHCFDFVHC